MRLTVATWLVLTTLSVSALGQGTTVVVDPPNIPPIDTPAASLPPVSDTVVVAPDNSVGLGQFLFDKGSNILQNSQPSMFRDLLNNEWLYGAFYKVYQSNKMLPGLLPTSYRDKVHMPPVNFGVGLMAPVNTSKGTLVTEASADLTPAAKKGLLWAISKLPANLDQHLSVLTNVLKTDGQGSGILSLGGAGGRDFNQGIWRAGVSMHLSIKFGSASKDLKRPDRVDSLLAPGSDTPTAQ